MTSPKAKAKSETANTATEPASQADCTTALLPVQPAVQLWTPDRPKLLTVIGYQAVEVRTKPSPGLTSPLIEEARHLRLVDDFKYLSDLRELPLNPMEKVAAEARAEIDGANGRAAYVRSLLGQLYTSGPELVDAPIELTRARWELDGGTEAQRTTVAYTERMWSQLVKRTPVHSSGSLIPLPFPVVIPGARFQESYYWDSYFGMQSLLRTGRWDLAAMQIENFLFAIENYGLIPNGMRDYYLTRSQPPLLSSMIREVVQTAMADGQPHPHIELWLRERALPLLKKDYEQFWMNPATRYDAATGLNHYWDAKNTPREERHASDNEEALGRTYRDVRAEAESGHDFTEAFEGHASRTASVQLNFILYKVEKDLAFLCKWLGDDVGAARYQQAAEKRLNAINQYLWDPAAQTYYPYDLDRGERMGFATSEVFTALWSGGASKQQAEGIRHQLQHLEFAGGIAGSTKFSHKQWDAPNGWAPDQFFAIKGLRDYGFKEDAERIAHKWTEANERILKETGALWERIDVVRADKPEENGDKYRVQEGFLWTNSVYVWIMTDVFGLKLKPAG